MTVYGVFVWDDIGEELDKLFFTHVEATAYMNMHYDDRAIDREMVYIKPVEIKGTNPYV